MRTPELAGTPSVAVVIPAFHPGPALADLLRSIPPFVRHIVVVDDGSQKETAIQLASVEDSRIHFVGHEINRGVGAAVLTGYDVALELGDEIVVKMDCDGQMDPKYLPALLAPLAEGRADYVKGNRFLHTRQLRSMPLIRRVGNAGLSFLSKLASGYWNIFDPSNGYTAIRAAIVPLLDRSHLARRYFFETSMLLELSLIRAVVRDVYIPARYGGGERSRLSERKALFEFPPKLLAGFVRRIWMSYFLRDFTVLSVYLVLGALLTAFGLVWGISHWITSVMTNVPELTGTVMVGVLPVILGVQLLLQAVTLDVENVPREPIHRQESLLLHD